MNTIAAIDIGSTKVTALVAAPEEDSVRILGAGVVSSAGVERGLVNDLAAASDAVAEAVRLAELDSGEMIEQAHVSVGGLHVQSRIVRGETVVAQALRGVEPDDVERALAEADTKPSAPDRQVLHVIPRGFWLDDSVQVRDPVGLSAYKIEADVSVFTGLRSAIRNISKVVDEAGLEVATLMLQVMASGEAVLTEKEREMGVALVDIGGGTTSVGVYINGSLWHSITLPTGGHHITNDLAIGLHCPSDVAEDIKLRFGECCTKNLLDNGKIRVAGFPGSNLNREILREEVVRIIHARVEEIFMLVARELRHSSFDDFLPAGVVLCGGSAKLPGITCVAEDVLGLPTRVVAPLRAEGLTEIVTDPAQATAVGLLLWAIRQPRKEERNSRMGFWRRLGKVFRGVLPG